MKQNHRGQTDVCTNFCVSPSPKRNSDLSMVWYGMVWPESNAWRPYIRDCGTPGCELNSCMRCGDLGLAPSQMVSSLFRPSCALDEVDNRFVTQLAQLRPGQGQGQGQGWYEAPSFPMCTRAEGALSVSRWRSKKANLGDRGRHTRGGRSPPPLARCS